MMASATLDYNRRWVSFLVFSLLFIVLPLGLLVACFDFFLASRQEDAEQAQIREKQQLLVSIAAGGETLVRFRELCGFLHRRFVGRRIAHADWGRISENIRRRRGLAIDIYPFDAQGKLVLPPDSRVRAKSALQRLWKLFLYGDGSQVAQFRKVADELLGRSWDQWTIWRDGRARVHRFRGMGGEGLLYWDADPFSPNGGVLFVLWDLPPAETCIQAGMRHRRLPEGIEVFLQKRSGDILPLAGHQPTGQLELISRLCRDSRQSVVRYGQRLWLSFPTSESTCFLGFFSDGERLAPIRHTGIGILAILLLIGLFVCHRWIVLGRDAYLSIRIKLVFLFLYALLAPTLGLLTLSLQTLRETERGMREDLRKRGVETLTGIDEAFLDEPARFQKVMNRFKELLKDPANVARFAGLTRRERDRRDIWTLELRDGSGNPTHIAGPAFASDDILAKILRQMFCDGIKRFIPHRLNAQAEEKSGLMQGYMIDSLMGSDELGLTRFIEMPGKVRFLSLPKVEAFFYWDYFAEPGAPAALINGAMDLKIAVERYLKNAFLTLKQPTSVPMRLFAMDAFRDRWFPGTAGVTPEMRECAGRMWLSGERQFDRLSWGGRTWTMVAIPGKQIPRHGLLALVSEDGIVDALARLKRWIVVGLLATFFLTLLLGWMLSDTLLLPIGELGKGVEAIRSSQTRFRLSHFPKDELGDLSRAFNDMLEHLADLTAGKQVQEQLFPKAPLELGGYRVFGVSRPATHLGGDYFDYVRLDDRQFLVLIGDVTGHGIPAALIMAMSKAIVLTSTAAGETAEEMLVKLNRTINSVMRGRRLMSMGLAWVKPFEHRIEYFHLGHTFPIIWKADGTFSFITGTGMPIGVPTAIKPRSMPIALEPGDRLVFYTDGLVESLAPSGKTDAFNLFGEFLVGRPSVPLVEACEAVIREHPFFTTGAPQPDDFTVVMLERDGTSN